MPRRCPERIYGDNPPAYADGGVSGNLAAKGAGGETSEVKIYKDSGEYPFSGGSGALVSVAPTAFLIFDGKTCKTVNIGKTELDRAFGAFENIIERISEKSND